MTGLLEELRAAARPGGQQCKTCRWLLALSPAERAEWNEAFRDTSIKPPQFLKVLGKRGLVISEGSVRTHRTRGHQP